MKIRDFFISFSSTLGRSARLPARKLQSGGNDEVGQVGASFYSISLFCNIL